jgi:shikimate kinase
MSPVMPSESAPYPGDAAAAGVDARNLVLIGPMGSGKSTVGAALARRVGRPHVDTDQFFVARYGPIPEFFEQFGEDRFRHEEAQIVAELLDSPRPSVISLGGGAVIREANRDALIPHIVIMLDITAEQAERRLGDGSSRPILLADPAESPLQRWQRIYTNRKQVYLDCADIVVSPEEATVEGRVDEILRRLQSPASV